MGAHLYRQSPNRAGTSDAVLQTQEWLEGALMLSPFERRYAQRNLAVFWRAGARHMLRKNLASGV